MVRLGAWLLTSDTTASLIKYWMCPDELKKSGPDAIINGSSANDALTPSGLMPKDDWATTTSSLSEHVRNLSSGK